jgi:hypothetical protein
VNLKAILAARALGNHLVACLRYSVPECARPLCPCHENAEA